MAMKPKRRKVTREILEAKLLKNERRIQRIATESYTIRQSIEFLDSLPVQKPFVKEKTDAVLENRA